MNGADLFHISSRGSAREIFRNGLPRSRESYGAKRREELEPAMGHGPNPSLGGKMEKSDRLANEKLDEMSRRAKSRVDGEGKYPFHQDSIFFWTMEQEAVRRAKGGQVVVAVDSTKFPPECDCVVGPHGITKNLWKTLWLKYRGVGVEISDDEVYDRMVEYWEKAREYRGHAGIGVEVFCGCDIPPRAITRIYDAERGVTLYEPKEGGSLAQWEE